MTENNDKQNRNISIIQDKNGKSIVLINDICYKSRRSIHVDRLRVNPGGYETIRGRLAVLKN